LSISIADVALERKLHGIAVVRDLVPLDVEGQVDLADAVVVRDGHFAHDGLVVQDLMLDAVAQRVLEGVMRGVDGDSYEALAEGCVNEGEQVLVLEIQREFLAALRERLRVQQDVGFPVHGWPGSSDACKAARLL
jgi:hypothetical protein